MSLSHFLANFALQSLITQINTIMANRSNQNNNQSGKSGNLAGLAIGVSAASGAVGFGAGYGGAAYFDKSRSEDEPAPTEETQEEFETDFENDDVAFVESEELSDSYEEDSELHERYTEPHTIVGSRINDVAVRITPDEGYDVNPDQVTDEILAEELVDPNDIDTNAIVEFTGIETTYDADGNEMTVAFGTLIDEEMAFVDYDNDGTFDIMIDENGDGYDMEAEGLHYTVDDVEAQISDSAYIAATDTPDTVLENGDSFVNDIITV